MINIKLPPCTGSDSRPTGPQQQRNNTVVRKSPQGSFADRGSKSRAHRQGVAQTVLQASKEIPSEAETTSHLIFTPKVQDAQNQHARLPGGPAKM